MRVYIAGRYSADNVMEVLGNIRAGQEAAVNLMLRGYYVHCPWLDHQLVLSYGGAYLTSQFLKDNSMAFLEVCDAVYVLPGWETSNGTKAEIVRSKKLNIPVFYYIEKLNKYRESKESCTLTT